MKTRCSNPNFAQYADYGGRGITVCDEWVSSFTAFFRDMGPRPSKKHSLERLDNNGPYSKDNCTWALRHQQGRNTRANRMLTHDGRTQCITDWAKEAGITQGMLSTRLSKGIPLHIALKKRPQRRVEHVCADCGSLHVIRHVEWL